MSEYQKWKTRYNYGWTDWRGIMGKSAAPTNQLPRSIVSVIKCKDAEEVKEKYKLFRGMLPDNQFMDLREDELIIYEVL